MKDVLLRGNGTGHLGRMGSKCWHALCCWKEGWEGGWGEDGRGKRREEAKEGRGREGRGKGRGKETGGKQENNGRGRGERGGGVWGGRKREGRGESRKR